MAPQAWRDDGRLSLLLPGLFGLACFCEAGYQTATTKRIFDPIVRLHNAEVLNFVLLLLDAGTSIIVQL